ncbi:uncharacterized protein BYT42DRAFT_490880 [Radiomyces spectabilis]|uniref:uncharacterized protein n=1 Tax=Radiomyces spectabilis TaxID=64574 RepID=UPI00221E5641|nr:uncharacterized protein BYT42DRAFT_490880 [Radiomyces spectabilis]KAI8388752.1 hypothetical protein BYT42DRAFT_490880 [Radiomyces spectabilis]
MTIPDLLKESYNSTKEEAASPVVKSIVVNPPVVEPPVAEPSVVEPSVVESPVVKKKRGRPPRIASASVSQEPLKTTVKGRSRKNAPAPVPQEPPQTTVQGKKRGRTRKNAPAPVPQEPLQTAVEEKNLPKAEARRIYAKDLTCPPEFETYLKKIVPDYLLPLGTHDLFGCMPPNLRAENLMCYLGGSYTGTALHRDICGTFGHNIMLHTAPDAYSEWLLIEHRYRDALANVTHPPRSRVSGQKSFFLDSDRAWCSRHMLKKAGIKTHVIIQKLGDMVLIPSLCYHQVRNVGFSAKIAWNRATPHTLMAALDEHLPIYRSIVRPEVYRCKAMVCYALRKWLALLKKYEKDTDAPPTDTAVLAIMPSNDPEETSPSLMDLPMLQGGKALFLEECRILLHLLAKNLIQPETIETIEFEEVSNDIRNEACNAGLYTRTCDFCRSDIFFRYYHCSDCSDYDLCMNCYIRGRSCKHVDKMTMQQSRTNLNEYIQLYRKFIECVNNIFEKKCLFKENLSVV